jgi:hypothetical protein
VIALVILFLSGALAAGEDGPAGPRRTHTGVVRAEHLEVRYRPGSRAAASADRAAAHGERDLVAICRALDVRLEGRFLLFVYDDERELSLISETSGNAGFSTGRESHVPWDNDQTRFHELVHVAAAALLKPAGSERRSLFFAEGLANALLEHVTGVHVHAVAAFYRRQKRLPALAEMTGAPDFYAWLASRPGFNAYDVAGSWFRFLLDRYPAAKVTRYYGGAPAPQALGASEAELEKAWHRALDAYELRPEVELLLRQRHGESVTFPKFLPPVGLPAELLGRPGDWRPLAGEELRSTTPDRWKREQGAIVGDSDRAEWTVCELGSQEFGDCVVRARILTPTSGPVQVRLGPGNQAMLVNGTFLYNSRGPVAASDAVASMTPERKETDFVLVRRGRAIEVWIDERKALTATGDAAPAPVGLGFHQGRVTFRDVRVRKL